MDKINLQLPKLNYKNLDWNRSDNVSYQGRSDKFEEQNNFYQKIGYTENNTEYFQTFDIGDDIKNFINTLFDRCSCSIFKQMPGQTLPQHTDTFYTFAEKNNINPKKCIRLNVFLEDWKTGHYFEINDTPVLQWKAGDAIIIEYDKPHLSGNMGLEPKYTMQITGIYDEFKRS